MWLIFLTILYSITQCSGYKIIPREYATPKVRADYYQRQKNIFTLTDSSKEDLNGHEKAKNRATEMKSPGGVNNFGQVELRKGIARSNTSILRDDNIRRKISVLIEQCIHDTQKKIAELQQLRGYFSQMDPYKIGYLLSLIKRSRDVLNDLFDAAVRYRNQWRALEQLKIFELIVHTNVDTTNNLKQLVEIHLTYMSRTTTTVVTTTRATTPTTSTATSTEPPPFG